MSISDVVDAELAEREAFKQHVMDLVHSHCETGKGHVQRGKLQELVHHDLGFHGRPGNHFSRFIGKTLEENGYRKSYCRGHRVYYGLVWKTCETNTTPVT